MRHLCTAIPASRFSRRTARHPRASQDGGDPRLAVRVGSANGYAAIRIGWRTISATFSPIMILAALVLPETTAGMIEASATRRPPIPCAPGLRIDDRQRVAPILQVLVER